MQNRYKKKIQNRYKQKLNRYKTNTRDADNETDTKQIRNRNKKLIKKIQNTPTNQQSIRYKQHKYKTDIKTDIKTLDRHKTRQASRET